MELHVLVMGLSGLVRDMIEAAVEAQPGLRLLRAAEAFDLRGAIGALDPDVLVVGASDARLAAPSLEALHTRPMLRVVALDPLRGIGILYEMRPHAVALGDVSPGDIVSAIQSRRSTL